MSYQHQYVDGTRIHFPLGKVVCIGRNYAEHAKELDNPIPTEPLLFIKPGSCVVPAEGGFKIPAERGRCTMKLKLPCCWASRCRPTRARKRCWTPFPVTHRRWT